MTFRSPASRTVEVRLRPSVSEMATGGLVGVTIRSEGQGRSVHQVEQVGVDELLTNSAMTDQPSVPRHVMLSSNADSAMLERVLQDPGQDRALDGALALVEHIFVRD